MTKQEMLHALEDAKKLHQKQMVKIEQLLEGKEVKNLTPLGKMECGCGSWFYTQSDDMIGILGLQLFERLDKYHEAWHREYAKIYDIFYKKEKQGFFSKLLGASKVEPMELDKAKLYYQDLHEITRELLHHADVAIRRVSALSETKFH